MPLRGCQTTAKTHFFCQKTFDLHTCKAALKWFLTINLHWLPRPAPRIITVRYEWMSHHLFITWHLEQSIVVPFAVPNANVSCGAEAVSCRRCNSWHSQGRLNHQTLRLHFECCKLYIVCKLSTPKKHLKPASFLFFYGVEAYDFDVLPTIITNLPNPPTSIEVWVVVVWAQKAISWSHELFHSWKVGPKQWKLVTSKGYKSRWWFQVFFIFTPIWGRFPFRLIFFQMGWFNHRPEMVWSKLGIQDMSHLRAFIDGGWVLFIGPGQGFDMMMADGGWCVMQNLQDETDKWKTYIADSCGFHISEDEILSAFCWKELLQVRTSEGASWFVLMCISEGRSDDR